MNKIKVTSKRFLVVEWENIHVFNLSLHLSTVCQMAPSRAWSEFFFWRLGLPNYSVTNRSRQSPALRLRLHVSRGDHLHCFTQLLWLPCAWSCCGLFPSSLFSRTGVCVGIQGNRLYLSSDKWWSIILLYLQVTFLFICFYMVCCMSVLKSALDTARGSGKAGGRGFSCRELHAWLCLEA